MIVVTCYRQRKPDELFSGQKPGCTQTLEFTQSLRKVGNSSCNARIQEYGAMECWSTGSLSVHRRCLHSHNAFRKTERPQKVWTPIQDIGYNYRVMAQLTGTGTGSPTGNRILVDNGADTVYWSPHITSRHGNMWTYVEQNFPNSKITLVLVTSPNERKFSVF